MIYKYENYQNFLEYLKQLGEIVPFKDWKDNEKVFLLRHDVDLDINLAYILAQKESEVNVRSTFFILTTSDIYNILCKSNSQKLRGMADLGFEIGLHFDPSLYDSTDLLRMLKYECEILTFVTGSEVKSISLHNPSVYMEYPIFEGFINAYDPIIFNNDCYISDSRMNFRGKKLDKFVKRIKHSAIQILLHPMHYSETGFGYDEIMRTYLIELFYKIDTYFRINSTYNKQVPIDFIDKLTNR